jgi:hypothetical protein
MAHCSRSRSSRSTRVEPCQSGVKARSGTVWTWTRTKEQADSDPLTRARLKKSPPAESTAGRVKRCSLQSASRKAQFQIIR